MWHLAFPTKMEAFSLLNPVPVTVKRVPRPLDPGKVKSCNYRYNHHSLFSYIYRKSEVYH